MRSCDHHLNILGTETLAAATHLGADVFLSAASPELVQALRSSDLGLKVQPPATRR